MLAGLHGRRPQNESHERDEAPASMVRLMQRILRKSPYGPIHSFVCKRRSTREPTGACVPNLSEVKAQNEAISHAAFHGQTPDRYSERVSSVR